MFVVANLIEALAQLLGILLSLYMWVIIIRSLISWVSPDPYNPVVQFLYRITEPVLTPIRQKIGSRVGIDISPIVVIFIILFLQSFLVASLHQFARQLH